MKAYKGLKRVWKVLKFSFYLLFVTIIALEIILRIYNPIPTRIKGNKIILPANQTIYYKNKDIPVLDKEISVHYNSLGLRGPERPPNYDSCLSIVTVGGSTTACWNISDSKTWPTLLSQELSKHLRNVWLNNAGVSGQSSYGHIFMLNDHILKLRPKVIIFMTGVNDVNRTDIEEEEANSTRTLRQFLIKYSETYNLLLTILRNNKAIKHGLVNTYVNLKNNKYDTLVLSDQEIQNQLKLQEPLVNKYEERMRKLIDTCLKSKIYPMLLTQPVLFGDTIDGNSGVNLGTIKPAEKMNGILYDKMLDLYNNAQRKLAQEYGIPCIDLAAIMPKNSLYYFDFMHYTNEGTRKITGLIAPEIIRFLKNKFPAYLYN